MAGGVLSFRVDVPWQLIAVSRDMMDDYSPRIIRKFRVFLKATDATTGPADTQFLVTGRSLCAAFTCVTPVTVNEPAAPVGQPSQPGTPPVSILNESTMTISSIPITSNAPVTPRQPAIKEPLRSIQRTMSTSWRLPTRHPEGQIGFLDSDYFKNEIRKRAPASGIDQRILHCVGFPKHASEGLGADMTIAAALELDLAAFARKTGLCVAAAAARRVLLRHFLSRQRHENRHR